MEAQYVDLTDPEIEEEYGPYDNVCNKCGVRISGPNLKGATAKQRHIAWHLHLKERAHTTSDRVRALEAKIQTLAAFDVTARQAERS